MSYISLCLSNCENLNYLNNGHCFDSIELPVTADMILMKAVSTIETFIQSQSLFDLTSQNLLPLSEISCKPGFVIEA